MRYLVWAAVFLFTLSSMAMAQWSNDPTVNTPICVAPGEQLNTAICADGSGGAIIAWEDHRTDLQIYAQHVNASGFPLWEVDGIPVCPPVVPDVKMIPDGAGGAIFLWVDQIPPNTGFFAQRINSLGQKLWGSDGVQVEQNDGVVWSLNLVADGSGGGIIVWVSEASGLFDVRAQLLEATGALRWPAGGVVVADSLPDPSANPGAVSDFAGGCIVTWQEPGNGSDILASRVGVAGNVMWLIEVCTDSGDQTNPHIIIDFAGGAVISYEVRFNDGTGFHYDLLAQHLNASGQPQWVTTVYSLDDPADHPAQIGEIKTASDGAGGAYFVWGYVPDPGESISYFAQRIDGTGNSSWPDEGIGLEGDDISDLGIAEVISDGLGNAIVTGWHSCGPYTTPCPPELFVTRISPTGVMQRSTINSGSSGGIADPGVTSDGSGGAIVAWRDSRNDGADIYAQRVDKCGYLPNGIPANYGFDPGTDPWKFYTNGAGTFDNNATGVCDRAAHIAITQQGTNVQLYQSGIDLEPNAVYRLSFRAYSNKGHDVSVSLHRNAPPYTPNGLTNAFFNLTTSWQEYSVEFLAMGFTGGAEDSRLKFWFAPYDANGDHYYFDNVAFQKVGNPQPPAITYQTDEQIMQEGQTATFIVTATGSAPLAYQWQKNGQHIPGAEATGSWYTTPALTVADNGSTYRCVVSNPYGSVVSTPAVLTVLPSEWNAVANPGFETGTVPWTFYTNGVGSFGSASPGYQDLKSGKVVISSTGSNIQLLQSGVTIEAQTTYMLSFAAYSSSGHNVSITLQRNDAPYTGYGLQNRVVDLGTGWQMYSITFTSTNLSLVTNARLRFAFNGHASAGDVYHFDNVVLVVPWAKEQSIEYSLPREFCLHQNYPNPFNPLTMINYQLPINGYVTLKVYDVLGKEITTLVNEMQGAGFKSVEFDASNVASGVYLYRIQAGDFAATRKLIVVK